MADVKRSPQSNIYTVLALIALLVLAAGVAYVLWRHYQIFTGNPFQSPATAAFLTPAAWWSVCAV